MKKIGILTFQQPENKNFGAIIQAYAIVKLYEKLGLNAKLINYINYNLNLKERILYFLEGKGFKRYSKNF